MHMHCYFRSSSVFRWLRSNTVLLWIVWIIGLLLGALLAPAPSDPSFFLIRPYLSGEVSIVSHLTAVSLPLLLAAYAVNINKPILILLISFLKAVHFSYCGCLIYTIYGSAGWLVRFLFQFADIFAVPVFCWFCIRQLSGTSKYQNRERMVCIGLTFFFAITDILLISPFLAKLLHI